MTNADQLPRDVEVSLAREAALSSMAIGTGLTHLRKYDFNRPGFFYSGVQSFTTGLERLLKLMLIYDFRLTNGGEFPDNTALRQVGHRLGDLVGAAREINERRALGVDDRFLSDSLYDTLLCFLTDFAMQARYYNLDYITGKRQSGIEPLSRWDEEICEEIVRRHYTPSPARRAQIEAIAGALEPMTWVQLTAESGEEIRSMLDFMMRGETVAVKQKYSMYYLYLLVRFVCRVCFDMERGANFYPNLREYFVFFMLEDRSHILRKKSWNPMPPFHF